MTKVGRPKQYGEARDTAETLKKSALDLFSRRSYHAVSIKDIGREANLTAAMIYYHFRDKNDLFCATVEHAIENSLSHFDDVSENIDHPAALIHEWLQMHVGFHSQISKVLKLIIDYNHSDMHAERVDKAIHLFYDTERQLLTRCIRNGVDLGVFSASDPIDLSNQISIFLDGAVMRTQILADYDITSSIQIFEDELWDMLSFSGFQDEKGWPN